MYNQLSYITNLFKGYRLRDQKTVKVTVYGKGIDDKVTVYGMVGF